MEQEYYYNPQTNQTFSKGPMAKVAVPENFSKVDKSVYDSFITKGSKRYGNPQPNGRINAIPRLQGRKYGWGGFG